MLRTQLLFTLAAIVAISTAMTYDNPVLKTLSDTAEQAQEQAAKPQVKSLADTAELQQDPTPEPCLAEALPCTACGAGTTADDEMNCGKKSGCTWDGAKSGNKCRACTTIPCFAEAATPDQEVKGIYRP